MQVASTCPRNFDCLRDPDGCTCTIPPEQNMASQPLFRVINRGYATLKPKRAPVLRTRQGPPRSVPAHASPKPQPPPPPPSWTQSPSLRRSARILAWSANVIAGLCAVTFVRDNFVRIDVIRGSSMSPTLSPTVHETGAEDWVVISPVRERAPKIQYEHGRAFVQDSEQKEGEGVRRGDIVTFWKPHKPEEISIKRVVALPGDVVYPKRGYALDHEVVRRERAHPLDGLPEVDPDAIGGGVGELEVGRVVVPYGHVWVEGDNLRNSFDSRDFGPLAKGLIEGRAVKIWRGWLDWRDVGDEREKKGRSKIVKGRGEVPRVFLE